MVESYQMANEWMPLCSWKTQIFYNTVDKVFTDPYSGKIIQLLLRTLSMFLCIYSNIQQIFLSPPVYWTLGKTLRIQWRARQQLERQCFCFFVFCFFNCLHFVQLYWILWRWGTELWLRGHGKSWQTHIDHLIFSGLFCSTVSMVTKVCCEIEKKKVII